MPFIEFISLTIWIFLVNFVVNAISLNYKTRLGLDFGGILVAIITLALADIFLIIAALIFRKRKIISARLIMSLLCGVFLVKFGIVIQLLVMNGHILQEHWILMPYNSRTLIASIELTCNVLTFIFHLTASLIIIKPLLCFTNAAACKSKWYLY